MIQAESEATKAGLDMIGIYHSHPDHPNVPSEFDREYALPWYVYFITSVEDGTAIDTRCWRLLDDRSGFEENLIEVKQGK